MNKNITSSCNCQLYLNSKVHHSKFHFIISCVILESNAQEALDIINAPNTSHLSPWHHAQEAFQFHELMIIRF